MQKTLKDFFLDETYKEGCAFYRNKEPSHIKQTTAVLKMWLTQKRQQITDAPMSVAVNEDTIEAVFTAYFEKLKPTTQQRIIRKLQRIAWVQAANR
jgi:hypothetical protein